MVTEGAFGKLKGRFRVLHRKSESRKDTHRLMALACVVLHNICIEKHDTVPRTFNLTLDPSSQKMRRQEDIRDILDMTDASLINLVPPSSNAKEIRDQLAGEKQYQFSNY